MLESRLGMTIGLRGNRVVLTGDELRIDAAARALQEVSDRVMDGREIGEDWPRRW
ncbi:MAG: hypothetical protein R2878_06060 [Thermoleophilia bacterium]